ncbi:MAG: hypothetical protein VKJ09_09980 [Leptolyngbya sp.]|nr:hypothetical protein [Leptolyngbya sp.]
MGVRAGNDVVGRGIQASRNAVSSNPAAASNLTPLEQAGQNVQRQSQTNATGNTVPNNTGATGATNADGTTGATDTAGNAAPSGTETPASAQDPIPALW